MKTDLGTRLLSHFDLKNESSFFQLKELLGVVAGALPNNGLLPEDSSKLSGFRLAQRCLYQLREGRKNLTRDGILFKGFIPSFSPSILSKAQEEMKDYRKHALRDRWDQFISKPGPIIKNFSESQELRDFVQGFVGPLQDEVACTCIYYDKPGAQIPPHVDVDNFCVNVNILILQEFAKNQSSNFILYPLDSEPVRIDYSPGELLVFYADSFVHSRTPLSVGETVYAVSIGFRPLGELHKDERI